MNRKPSSRWVAGLTAITLTVAACGGEQATESDASEPNNGTDTASAESEQVPNDDSDVQKLRLGLLPGAFYNLPADVADQEGFFEEAGLDVDLVRIPSGPEMVGALASGSVDVMVNSPGNTILGNTAGQDMVTILGGQMAPLYSWVAQNDWPTPNEGEAYPQSIVDMKGARIGVPVRGSEVENFTRILLEDAGLDPDKDVTFVAIGAGQTALSAYDTGQIDILGAFEPAQTLLVDMNKTGKVVVDLRYGDGPEHLANWQSIAWQALRSTTQDKAEPLRRFQSAMASTYEFMKDPTNKDRVVEINTTVLDLDPKALAAIYDNNVELLGPEFSCANYENVVQLMLDTEQISEGDRQSCEEFVWDGAAAYTEK